ncbi:unnamed protein product, partial [Staurois parvus]
GWIIWVASGRPGQQRAGSEVPEEQAEKSQSHKPGSVTHGQHGTEDQAEGWSGKPGIKQEKSAEVRIRQVSITGTQDTRYRGLIGNNTPRP